MSAIARALVRISVGCMVPTLGTAARRVVGGWCDRISYLRRRTAPATRSTVGSVRQRWIDLLIVLAAVAGAVQIALGNGAANAPDLPVGLAMVAAAAIALPLL